MSGSLSPFALPAPAITDAAQPPSMADAWQANMKAVGDWINQQRAKSAAMGLWNDQAGMPTQAGLVNAAQQYGNGVMMGSVTPSPVPKPFAGWFGASKVASPEGYPLQVYHGTPSNAEIGVFSHDAPKTTGGGLNQEGFFFSENPNVANRYAEFNGPDNGQVLPSYLSAQQPLKLTAPEFERLQEAQNVYRNGGSLGEIKRIFLQDMLEGKGVKFDPARDPMSQIREAGFDAIHKDSGRYGLADQEWMVFHPDQIKSAIQVDAARNPPQQSSMVDTVRKYLATLLAPVAASPFIPQQQGQ